VIVYIDCTVQCSISFMHESKLQTANRFSINAIHFYGLQYKFLCTHKITPNSHYISKDRNTSLYSTHLQPFIFESIKSSSYVVNRFYCNKYSFWSNFDDSQTLRHFNRQKSRLLLFSVLILWNNLKTGSLCVWKID
jgi:hypothetical protein